MFINSLPTSVVVWIFYKYYTYIESAHAQNNIKKTSHFIIVIHVKISACRSEICAATVNAATKLLCCKAAGDACIVGIAICCLRAYVPPILLAPSQLCNTTLCATHFLCFIESFSPFIAIFKNLRLSAIGIVGCCEMLVRLFLLVINI